VHTTSSVQAATSARMAIMCLVAHSGGINARVKRIGDIRSMGGGSPIVGAHRSSSVTAQVTDLSTPVV
jgi:hypothetical protein